MKSMEQISFDQWKKIEMRVGEVLKVERVAGADKLYKLNVRLGNNKFIQIVTALVPFYTEQELRGKKIVVLVNLKPAKIRGEISEGMLLCAEDKQKNQCVLLTVEKDIEAGTLVT